MQVWLAEWTGCAVAVKELLGFNGQGCDDKLWEEMQNEVHLLGTYNHPNIMRFMAVCIEPPMIVMQYYPHGSLFDLLTVSRMGWRGLGGAWGCAGVRPPRLAV